MRYQNKNMFAAFWAIIALVCAAAAQQSAPAPKTTKASPSSASAPAGASSQKVVLRVGSAQVTQSQIETVVSRFGPRAQVVVATQGMRPVADEYVKTLVLSQRALQQHLDSSPALRFELQLQREQTLAQAEYQKMASEVRISPEEVSRYFAAHQQEFETVQVREFLIRKRPAASNDPRLGLPIARAKAKAEAIRKALLRGKDIEKVGSDFYSPPDVMLIDPKVRSLRRSEMKPALSQATFNLKAGGVTEPVDTPQAFIVVKVFGHHHPELKEVAAEIEGKLRQEKLNAEIDSLKQKIGVWTDDAYFNSKPALPTSSRTQAPFPGTPRSNRK